MSDIRIYLSQLERMPTEQVAALRGCAREDEEGVLIEIGSDCHRLLQKDAPRTAHQKFTKPAKREGRDSGTRGGCGCGRSS